MSDEFEPMLDTVAVANWFSVHPKTVSLMAKNKELPAIKVGGVWRFRRDELRTWLADQALTQARR